MRMDFKRIEMKFDGDLFKDHVVPLEMYAEAMLAFGKAVRRTDLHASGLRRDLRVSIKAHGQGSFLTELIVEVPDVFDRAVGALTRNEVDATLNAAGLLGVAIGAIAALKKLSGRAFELIESSTRGYQIIRTLDGTEFTVLDAVAQCLEDPRWRAAVDELTIPLEDEGVDSLSWSTDGDEDMEIKSCDRPAFVYIPSDDDVEVTVEEMTVKPMTVALAPDTNWKFAAPGIQFSAQVLDQEFADGVASKHVHVGLDDLLRVSVRTIRFPDNRRPRRAIIKVHEHIEAPEQGSLFD